MRAALLKGPGAGLVVGETEAPRPAAHEVVVDVTACGICGSDLHIAALIGAPGTILGHEIAGRVADIGTDVTGWSLGTPVAVRPFAGCRTCDWCSRGRADHCASFGLLGLDRPGGFAEHVAVAADELYRLPSSLTGTEQALIEPLAIARHALRRVGFQAGEDLLVLGGGPVGLAVTAWARTLGARRVVVSDPVAVRRDLAVTLGADAAVDPTSTALDEVVHEVCGGPPPVVMECTGVAGLIGQGIGHAAVNGRVGVVGICLSNDEIFPLFGIQKDLDIRFAIYYDREDFTDTLSAIDRGDLLAAAMVTETVSLADLPARFTAMSHQPDAGKVVVVP